MADRSTVQHLLKQAFALHEAGELRRASALYRDVIGSDPQNHEALHLLGAAELALGNASGAAALIAKAISVHSGDARYHTNLGLSLSHLGHLVEALAAYDRALAINPNSANTLNHRANALAALGRADQALANYARALSLNPRHADALNNRGALLAKIGRAEEALASFDRALAADPKHAGVLSNRGAILISMRRFHDALNDLDRAAALDAANANVQNNRGNALCGLRRYPEALAAFDIALQIDPRCADTWFNRGTALSEIRRFEDAISSFDRALALQPDHLPACIDRGQALEQLGRTGEALRSYDDALRVNPDDANVLVHRAHLLSNIGEFDRALADYDRALAADPGHEWLSGWRAFCKLKICDWRGIANEVAEIEAPVAKAKRVCSPAVCLALSDSPETLRRCAETYVAAKFGSPAPAPPLRTPASRIRLGYFSADFHEHATAHLTAGLIGQHDRTKFEVFAFSFGPAKQDPMRARLQNAFDSFIDVRGLADDAIVQLARSRGIDVAVDMKGFTEGSRTGVFAMRAAPVQVSYLGYPGTMAADFIDYIIADDVVIPDHAERHFSEKIVRLPGCYQPNDSKRLISAASVSRAQLGLPEQGFVFCCFNNNYKILPRLFDIWMRLLRRVDGSVLWLLQDNIFAANNLRSEARARGINPERLVFAARIAAPEHLARHRLADLFFDTLPYNAHTTASDALWAGLPVLTCSGESFQSRVAASLLSAAGLPELVTSDLAKYETGALDLALNPAKLHALRQKLLANRMSYPLFDTARYTRALELAYATMWQHCAAGKRPETFRVPADSAIVPAGAPN